MEADPDTSPALDNRFSYDESLNEDQSLDIINDFFKKFFGNVTLWGEQSAVEKHPTRMEMQNIVKRIRKLDAGKESGDKSKEEEYTFRRENIRVILMILITHIKMCNEIEFKDEHKFTKLTMFISGVLADDNPDPDSKPLEEFLLQLIKFVTDLSIFSYLDDEARKTIFDDDFLYICLWLLLLFGSKTTSMALKQCSNLILRKTPLPNLKVSKEVVRKLLIMRCSKKSSKLNYSDPTFLVQMLSDYFESMDCELALLANFIRDLPIILHLLDKSEVTKTTKHKSPFLYSAVLHSYASLTSAVILKKIKDDNSKWSISDDWKFDLETRLVPVLLSNYLRLQDFTEMVHNAPHYNLFCSTIEARYKAFANTEEKSSKDRLNSWLADKSKAIAKRDSREKSSITAAKQKVKCLMEKHGRQSERATVSNVLREELYKKLCSLNKLTHFKESTIVSTSDLFLTAFSVASCLLSSHEKSKASGNCEVYVIHQNFDKFNTYTENIIQKFDHNFHSLTEAETNDKRVICWGTDTQLRTYLKKTEKLNIQRFGVLVDVLTEFPQATVEVLTPMMLLTWMYTNILLQCYQNANKKAPKSSSEPEKMAIAKFMKTQLESKLPNFSFSLALLQKHAEVALSILKKEKKYYFDERMCSDIVADMREHFENNWISIRESDSIRKQTKRTGTCDYKMAGVSKPIHLTPLYFCDESKWLQCIENETKGYKARAVVLTGTPLILQLVKTHFKKGDVVFLESNLPGASIKLEKNQVLLLDISLCVSVTSDADVHFISCCFPQNTTEHLRLNGCTVCYDVIFSQRHILCSKHFPVSIWCFVEEAHRIHIKTSNWNRDPPVDENSDDNDLKPVIVDDFIAMMQSVDCWEIKNLIDKELNSERCCKGTNEKDIASMLHSILNNKTSLWHEVKKWGAPVYDDIDRIHEKGKQFAVEKHFAKVEKFSDFLERATANLEFRQVHQQLNPKGERFVHFPCDPDKYDDGKEDPKYTVFESRTALDAIHDEEERLTHAKIIKGSFKFQRTIFGKNDKGQMLPYLYHYTGVSDSKEAFVYEKLHFEESVVSHVGRLEEKAKEVEPILEHHKQVLNTCSPGHIYTDPVDKIKIQNNTFSVKLKNVSSSILSIQVTSSIPEVFFGVSSRNLYNHKTISKEMSQNEEYMIEGKLNDNEVNDGELSIRWKSQKKVYRWEKKLQLYRD